VGDEGVDSRIQERILHHERSIRASTNDRMLAPQCLQHGVNFKPSVRLPVPGDPLGQYAYEGEELTFPPNNFRWTDVQLRVIGSTGLAEWNQHGVTVCKNWFNHLTEDSKYQIWPQLQGELQMMLHHQRRNTDRRKGWLLNCLFSML